MPQILFASLIKVKGKNWLWQQSKSNLNTFIGNSGLELASGKQTLTLKQFIKKYAAQFLQLAKDRTLTNFSALYHQLAAKGDDVSALAEELRKLDLYVNVEWPLSHYKSAVRYLEKDPIDVAATGGTNWQKYLPPRFQKRIFYPFLWTEDQLDKWGKGWVLSVLKTLKNKD